MRYSCFILFLLLNTTVIAGGVDTSYTRHTSNRYTAADEIKALKHGALVVRLKTNDKSVEAYRRAGKTELADKIVADRAEMNQKIVEAFKYYFTFCKVYFIYAKNSDALLKHQQNIFLNEKMQPDTSIHLTEDYFLIAEYGSYTTNERADEYHYSGVYTTEPSNTTAGESALVILDTTFTQLREPFPFYAPVYIGSFIKAVEQLDRQFNKTYDNFRYKELIQQEKLKSKEARKK